MRTAHRLAALAVAAGLGTAAAYAALPAKPLASAAPIIQATPGVQPRLMVQVAPAVAPAPAVKKVIHSTPPVEYVGLKNPLTSADPKTLAATDTNIQEGKTLYERHCAPCHGTGAKGDGPETAGFLTPIRPVDLADPESLATLDQGYVFWRITEGGRETPFLSVMPSWKDELTEEERWQIILYIYKTVGVSPKVSG